MPAIAGPERRQRHSTGNVLGAAKRQFQGRVEPYSLRISTTPLNDIERRGGDVPLKGSDYQGFHADYQRPLFAEAPDM